MIEDRDVLARYVGKRMRFSGMYERSNLLGNNLKTTLLQDVQFEDETGEERYVGHMWVQHANAIWNARPMCGDELTFTARVGSYLKKLDVPNSEGLMSEQRPNLTHPQDVEILTQHEPGDYVKPRTLYDAIHRPMLVELPTPTPSAPSTDPIALLKRVKAVSGGLGAGQVIALLPHLDELAAIVRDAGGTDRLKEMVELLA